MDLSQNREMDTDHSPGPGDVVVGPTAQERQALEDGQQWDRNSKSFQDAKKCFEDHGVITVPGALPSQLVEAVLRRAKGDLSMLESELERQREALTEESHHHAVRIHRCDFRELVQRDGGRLDMRYQLDVAPLNSPLLSYNPVWYPLVQELLGGGDVTLLYMGVMTARNSTTDDQVWHADGGHLFEHEHCPPHCINVFIPLVDLVSSEDGTNGPTQFCPGTHRLGKFGNDSNKWPLCARSGDVVIFDYRIKHKGGANTTGADRPVLYLCYCRPWFRDQGNTRSKISLIPKTDPRFSNPWAARLLRGDAVSFRYQHTEGAGSDGVDAKRPRVQDCDGLEADEEMAGAGEHWPLFEMDVDLDDGAAPGANTIRVHNGDNPLELAAQFVLQRELPPETIEPLAESIAAQMEAARAAQE